MKKCSRVIELVSMLERQPGKGAEKEAFKTELLEISRNYSGVVPREVSGKIWSRK